MKVIDVENGSIHQWSIQADDQVLPASSVKELQDVIDVMCGSLKRKAMKVNVDKSKLMVSKRNDRMTECSRY